jgi:hypothetical protein
MTMNYVGLLTIQGESFMGFCGGDGDGGRPFAQSTIYSLNEGVIDGIDENYGPFWQHSTYPTYFFISNEEAEQKQLGVHRLQHLFMSMNVSGAGSVFVRAAADDLDNIVYTSRAIALQENSTRDIEFGLNLAAERISYRVCCQPAGPQPAPPTAPAGFKLSSMTLAVKTHGFSPIRGKNS